MNKRNEIPKVYIIILNWNNYNDTKRCLESTQKVTYQNLSVIVVDNASTDRSGNLLQAEFSNLPFIFNNKNLGFARGCNVGIREAIKDKSCAYVLLLNNDATVTPNFLEKAVEFAEMDGQIGLVGGKILQSPESKKIWYAGGRINIWFAKVVTYHNQIDYGQYDKPKETGFVTGGLMLIKREVLDKVGLLPEEYFFGFEEYDYSVRVKKAGYKLYYVPEFLIYHKGDGGHWNYDPKFVYNAYRNKLIFAEKFLPKWLFPIWKIIFIIYGKYFARRRRQKVIKKYKYKSVPLDDLDFALDKAIKDHGKNILSEETLLNFEESLKKVKN